MQLTTPVSLELHIENLVADPCTAGISDSTAIPKSRILLDYFFYSNFAPAKKILLPPMALGRCFHTANFYSG